MTKQTTQGHTPGKWNNNDVVRPFCVIDSKDRLVADCHTELIRERTKAENKANAQFIVTACNSYYELLEACRAALFFCHQGHQDGPVIALQRAIAKASS